MCDELVKMMSPMPLLLLALTSALAAPAAIYEDVQEQVPQKRAALVLDRLLIALQKALQDEANGAPYDAPDRDGPRTAPLRIADPDLGDMVSHRDKRPALVIDQLLMAIQKALRGHSVEAPVEVLEIEMPRAAPVIADEEIDMSSLERRGQANPGRGRVLRCYFNAVTCF